MLKGDILFLSMIRSLYLSIFGQAIQSAFGPFALAQTLQHQKINRAVSWEKDAYQETIDLFEGIISLVKGLFDRLTEPLKSKDEASCL